MIALNRVDLMAFFKYFPMTPIVLHYRIKCIPGGGGGGTFYVLTGLKYIRNDKLDVTRKTIYFLIVGKRQI